MLSWWHRDVIAAGKLPLMLCFVSFVVTFVSTRTITRLIRDGRGPFRNVTADGTHVHHSVPGIILLMIGAFTAVGGPGTLRWLSFSAIAIGIGTSLVLDEFALILHLQDVYWSGEGQLSVEAVSLVAACLGLALVGFSPLQVSDVDSAELSLRISATGILVIDACLALVCILKGKYRTGLFGLFLPPVGLFGAVLVLGHNAFDSVSPTAMSPMAGMLWRLLHVPGPLLPPSSGYLWLNLYPLIPWPGIMALGFVFGRVLQQTDGKRARTILLLGMGAIALFAIVRFTNSYGDPRPWQVQSSGVRTFLSFINVQKYPPSLLFVLVTLGLAVCLMALFDRWQNEWAQALRSQSDLEAQTGFKNARQLALYIVAAIEGAQAMAKAQQSREPLDAVLKHLETTLRRSHD
jgi:hypothetical protein